MRNLADHLGGDAGDRLAALERPVPTLARVLVEAGPAHDESLVLIPRDDLARIVFESAMSVPTSIPSQRSANAADSLRRGSTTISFAPRLERLQDMVEEDRMRLPRVRPPQHDEVGLLDLLVRAGTATGTEHGRQTDDGGRVSGAVAAIDVVGPKDLTSELRAT